jgi:hypothetical protein
MSEAEASFLLALALCLHRSGFAFCAQRSAGEPAWIVETSAPYAPSADLWIAIESARLARSFHGRPMLVSDVAHQLRSRLRLSSRTARAIGARHHGR